MFSHLASLYPYKVRIPVSRPTVARNMDSQEKRNTKTPPTGIMATVKVSNRSILVIG